jgi:inner membrane protein
MIIAHLPAGYITCRLLFNKFKHRVDSPKAYLFWGLLGSVAPDFNHLYFWFFDIEQEHHRVFTHYPSFWEVLVIGSVLWLLVARRSQNPVSAFMFSIGGFIHMILDTVTGHVFWLAPISYKPFSIGNMVETANPCLVDHSPEWSYGIELVILVWALWLFALGVRKERFCLGEVDR